jgi:predicted exporter
LIAALVAFAAALLVAPFPGLRQIAVFSLAGLAGSFLTVLLVVPDLLPRPIPARPRLFLAMDRLLRKAVALSRSRTVRLSLLLGGAVLALAALRTRADDDIRGLTQPSRPLQVQEARIQALTGMSNSACFILVEGQDEAQALAREEVLRQRLEGLIRPGGMEGLYALSSFVPSEARQEANLARNRERWPLLAGALRDSGFRPEAVAALQADLEASARQPLRLADFFQTTFSVPFRMLWLGPTGKGVATLVYPLGAPDSRALAQAASGLPGVTLVDKAQSVSSLLGHYRAIALWALGGAVVLVWLVLVLVYGLGAGTLVLGPALLGILASMAGLGLSGTPMSLFTALALILVLGFGVDYTVFLKEGGHRNPSSLLGVVLASLATMISYGLLVFSHTPALRGFGLTLGLGVLASTLLSFAALGHGREVTR